jgi:rubredoxin
MHMPIAVALDDVRDKQVKRDLEGGSLRRTPFIESPAAGAPQAFMVQYDPNRTSRAHFHHVDQFQIVVDGKGKIGRHDLAPYAVHFARAFTPYGPLAASPEGMTFLTLRRSHDPGAQRLPESKPKLEAVPDRRPWQITCDAAFGSQGMPQSGVLVQPIADIKDEGGLATYAVTMSPNAMAYAPDPSRSQGQFLIVLEGSLLYDEKEHKGLTVVSIDPHERQFQMEAGAQGLKGLILSFPMVAAKQAIASHSSLIGDKAWHCVLCAFVYDEAAGLPEDGIAPGTRWEDVPESWTCPDCAATKRDFQMIEL